MSNIELLTCHEVMRLHLSAPARWTPAHFLAMLGGIGQMGER